MDFVVHGVYRSKLMIDWLMVMSFPFYYLVNIMVVNGRGIWNTKKELSNFSLKTYNPGELDWSQTHLPQVRIELITTVLTSL